MMSDPIADLLTRIRNGYSSQKSAVPAPASKYAASILDVLKSEGYIRGFKKETVRTGIETLDIELKYQDGMPVIKEISKVSTPGRRVYSNSKDLPRMYGGLGTFIISTNQGLMSDAQAREQKLGGEIICKVY